MKKKKTKKECQCIHFQKRSIERIGVLINRKEIIRKIQKNELEFIERKSNRVTKWRYNFLDKNYIVIYDKLRKQAVTIYEEKPA